MLGCYYFEFESNDKSSCSDETIPSRDHFYHTGSLPRTFAKKYTRGIYSFFRIFFSKTVGTEYLMRTKFRTYFSGVLSIGGGVGSIDKSKKKNHCFVNLCKSLQEFAS